MNSTEKERKSLWTKITDRELNDIYKKIIESYKELDNSEWLKYLIIRQEYCKTWLDRVDRKIKHKDISPSLFFIWYAYEYLGSKSTVPVFIVNELIADTPEEKEKRKQKLRERQRIKYQKRKERETPLQRETRLKRTRENSKAYRDKKMLNETQEEKELRLAKRRELARERLKKETPTERKSRLAKLKEKRLNETPEEREKRLLYLKEYYYKMKVKK
ncbi:hypothetical protein [Aquimarina algiphila]|uniref:Uncharacterized protein n=1 Tax=Aquimarina algiphila TaxID=2047982 RepID=A0A554VAD6_9FLAO|nr:hypothetical protein [Aquimarina algiphila]TSE03047.1 hypothetical protein FOF46_30140 [Aquimarina algiphila]